MKHSPELELDYLIDQLNNEQKPQPDLSSEASESLAVVRAVKALRPQAEPDKNLGNRIYDSIKPNRRSWMPVSLTAIAAGLLLFMFFTTWNNVNNIVYAMEKAVANLTSYHGVIEVREKNANGDEWLIRRVEIWSEGNKYAVLGNQDTLTVHNGSRHWQVRPEDKEVALLPLIPNQTGQGFDLRDEAKRAKQYPYSIVGQETVAGHRAVKLKISPPGGLPYYLWVDRKTDLPLRIQTAMQNSLQTTYTYTSFEPNLEIDPSVFTYKTPEGYKIIEKDPGQQVATAAEAGSISKFVPLLPEVSPSRIFAFKNRIVLDYGDTSVVEFPISKPFKPENYAAVGKAAGGPLEVLGEHLRWQQKGVEIIITGPKRIDLARQMTPDLTLPDSDKNLVSKAQVKVPVDIAIVKADQQQVDGGHSPWQLDPLMVSLTFVNLQVSPEGIQGEPQIPESSFKLAANNGIEAVAAVSDGPIKQVYLKRLIRQDETGIWSVVGYDPR